MREVEAVLEHLHKAYYNRDLDAQVSSDVYFTGDADEDFVLFDLAPPMRLVGLEIFRKRATDFFNVTEGPQLSEWTDTYINVVGDIAYFHGTWKTTFKLKDQAEPTVLTMRETLVLRRIDGRFKIVHEHCSVPLEASGY
ncbi:nuclear transport factor 2 family protein [Nocardia sp. NPDC004123]